jgi:predicted site-specific integrase-resolvase
VQQAIEVTLFGLEDAAKALGRISSWTLRKHVKLGTIKVVRIGRRLFINQAEIQRIQAEGLPSLRAPESR